MVELLFLAIPWGCMRFVIVVFTDHTHLLFFKGAKSLTMTNLYIFFAKSQTGAETRFVGVLLIGRPIYKILFDYKMANSADLYKS